MNMMVDWYLNSGNDSEIKVKHASFLIISERLQDEFDLFLKE